MGRTLQVLSVTAVADLLARGGAELLSRGGLEVVPVVAVASVKLVTQLERLGWLLGWLLLAGVVFQTAPLLFPTDDRDWPASLQGRSGVAAGAVAAGMLVESAILEQQPGFQGTLPLEQTTLLVGVGVVLGSYLVAVGGDRPFERSWVYDPGDLDVHLDDGRVTFGRYVLFVLVLGVLLSATSLLFPLPELVVVGSQLGQATGVSLWAVVSPIPGGTDVGERLARGAAAVWAGVEYVPFLGYALVLLVSAFSYSAAYLRAADLAAMLRTTPLDAFVISAVVGTVIVLTVMSVDRYLERLYLKLGEDPERRAEVPRVPGLLVPAGLLLFGLELSRPEYPTSSPMYEDIVREANTVPGLEVTAASAAVLALGFALAVATLALSGRFEPRDSRLPDIVALPLSVVSLFAGLLLTQGGLDVAATAESAAGLVGLGLLVGLYPASFVEFERIARSIDLFDNFDKTTASGLFVCGCLSIFLSGVLWFVAVYVQLTGGGSWTIPLMIPSLLAFAVGVTGIALAPFVLSRKAGAVGLLFALLMSVMYLLKGG
jgi:hypothetical protein